jgi:choline kinase
VRQQVVILAAGRGTRLGRPHPKPLTQLADGRTIMQQQLDNVTEAFPGPQVYIVVGFKLEMVLEAHPEAVFVYNEVYDETNTSKSLLRALRATNDGGVLWMNGDVVFDATVLERAAPLIDAGQSFIAVNTASVADEEIKYTVGLDGWIEQLSKTAPPVLGEAVGVNYVAAADKAALIRRLAEVDDDDYFERGVELAIERDRLRFAPLDLAESAAVEIDTVEDLESANRRLRPVRGRQ